MTTTLRFAPSPTGKLHVGNVRTALINWLFARGQGGQFILRIDDTDPERSTQAFEDAIKHDLEWLGLTWDKTFRQSERMARYDAVRDELIENGLLYPCYETGEELDKKRKLQRAAGKPPVYDRAALALTDQEKQTLEAEGRKPHWRFKLSGDVITWTDLVRGHSQIDTKSVSDPVLIRADGQYLYTLCSVVDDYDERISHVVRGEDHVTNSGAQIEIFKAIGDHVPQFAHTSLLVGADGEGLSKRLGSLSIEGLRDDGFEAMAITTYLAQLGTNLDIKSPTAAPKLAEGYKFNALGRAPARFNPDDLKRLNAAVMAQYDYNDVQAQLTAMDADIGEQAWGVIRDNLHTLADVRDWLQVITGPVDPDMDPDATAVLQAAHDTLPDTIDDQTWSSWTKAVSTQTGAKGKGLFMPLRRAITGKRFGPDMGQFLPLLDRDAIVKRLAGHRA